MQSPGNGKSAFESLFEFVATGDDTPYLCIPAALNFRNEICGGEERIHDYLYQLANESGDIFAHILQTEVIQEPGLNHWSESLFRKCAMTTVKLPIPVRDGWENDPTTGFAVPGKKSVCEPLSAADVQRVCRWMQEALVERHGTFLPVFPHGGWLWTRLSAQVYLEKRDFEWAASIVKELCAQVGKAQAKL